MIVAFFGRCYNAVMGKPLQFSMARMFAEVALWCIPTRASPPAPNP
jgi:hypothetical protein